MYAICRFTNFFPFLSPSFRFHFINFFVDQIILCLHEIIYEKQCLKPITVIHIILKWNGMAPCVRYMLLEQFCLYSPHTQEYIIFTIFHLYLLFSIYIYYFPSIFTIFLLYLLFSIYIYYFPSIFTIFHLYLLL